MRGLAAAVDRILDRRLSPAARRPLAVALSGGGDSLALTLLADAWARRHGRELLVLTVDHRLQAGSERWVEACRATAVRLVRPFHALAWEGEKPKTGLPAAAREARHRLLAYAARQAGAQVILMGHTGDDVLEAGRMREAGATTPDPREWGPSPAWPEGRGVFLLRPLLEVRRGELRDWLAEAGEHWIEDPANADPRFARARARMAGGGAAPARLDAAPLALGGQVREAFGALTLDRAALREASDGRVRLVAMAAVCAGGGTRTPSRMRSARLAEALCGPEDVVASLAGARVRGDARSVTFAREPGEAARNGLRALTVTPGAPAVWDGRFEIATRGPPVEVRRLAGLAAQLPEAERRRLRDAPADARGALPVVVAPDGAVSCPLLAEASPVTARSLVAERLAAASGLVECESP